MALRAIEIAALFFAFICAVAGAVFG